MFFPTSSLIFVTLSHPPFIYIIPYVIYNITCYDVFYPSPPVMSPAHIFEHVLCQDYGASSSIQQYPYLFVVPRDCTGVVLFGLTPNETILFSNF